MFLEPERYRFGTGARFPERNVRNANGLHRVLMAESYCGAAGQPGVSVIGNDDLR
jgi:hypothetical protein